jgi:hypothetical protein
MLAMDELIQDETEEPIPLKIQHGQVSMYIDAVSDTSEPVEEYLKKFTGMFGQLKHLSTSMEIDEDGCERVAAELQARLTQRDHRISPTAVIPADTYQDVLTLHMNVIEVLKHFWGCFPPSSESRKVKGRRMLKVLELLTGRIDSMISSVSGEESDAIQQVSSTN